MHLVPLPLALVRLAIFPLTKTLSLDIIIFKLSIIFVASFYSVNTNTIHLIFLEVAVVGDAFWRAFYAFTVFFTTLPVAFVTASIFTQYLTIAIWLFYFFRISSNIITFWANFSCYKYNFLVTCPCAKLPS
jgi:hypothetical protein